MKKFTKASLLSLLMGVSFMINIHAMDNFSDLRDQADQLGMSLHDDCEMMETDRPKKEFEKEEESLDDLLHLAKEKQEFTDKIVAITLENEENPEFLSTLGKFPSLLATAEKMKIDLERYRHSSSSSSSTFSISIENGLWADLCTIGSFYLEKENAPNLEGIAQQIINSKERDDHTQTCIRQHFLDISIWKEKVRMRHVWFPTWMLAKRLQMDDFIINEIKEGCFGPIAERVNRGIIAYALLLKEMVVRANLDWQKDKEMRNGETTFPL